MTWNMINMQYTQLDSYAIIIIMIYAAFWHMLSLVPRPQKTWPGTYSLRMHVISWNFGRPYHAPCSLRYSNLPSWIPPAEQPIVFDSGKDKGHIKGPRSVHTLQSILRFSVQSTVFLIRWLSNSNWTATCFWTYPKYFTENAKENVADVQTVSTRPSFLWHGYKAKC